MGGYRHLNTAPTMSLERKNSMEQKKLRGKGVKPAKVLISIRLDTEVIEFFKGKYPHKWQAEVRKVLVNFINKEK